MGAAAAGFLGAAGCLGGGRSGGAGESGGTAFEPAGPWRDTRLRDVRTDEEFSVADFAGTPVLMEFFAVWCPVCTNQQKQIAALHDRMDGVVSISLNTDPNEDAAKVREHLDRHGFDWRYAVAPAEMTDQLVDQFGAVIADPPSAPVVMVCGDGRARRLPNGVKPPDELQAAIETGC